MLLEHVEEGLSLYATEMEADGIGIGEGAACIDAKLDCVPHKLEERLVKKFVVLALSKDVVGSLNLMGGKDIKRSHVFLVDVHIVLSFRLNEL